MRNEKELNFRIEQFPSSKPLGQDDPDPYVYSSLNKNRSDLHAVPRLQNNRLKWLYVLEICRYYFKPNSTRLFH